MSFVVLTLRTSSAPGSRFEDEDTSWSSPTAAPVLDAAFTANAPRWTRICAASRVGCLRRGAVPGVGGDIRADNAENGRPMGPGGRRLLPEDARVLTSA